MVAFLIIIWLITSPKDILCASINWTYSKCRVQVFIVLARRFKIQAPAALH